MTLVLEPETRGGPMPACAFLRMLAQLIRAEDTYGAWDGKSDALILADFIVTREDRQEIPIIGDPDPDVIWRLEKFYTAIGLLLEQRTGCMAAPMTRLSWEGFGRIVLIAGRLVVLSRHLRDVHRFGFESYAKLAEAGERLLDEAVRAVATYPDAARA
jgi:probable nitrogen fixation protein